MAILDSVEREGVWRDIQAGPRLDSFGVLTKDELRAAVDAIDNWVDNNVSQFNTAIPLPARSVLTAKQKAELLMLVVARRWRVS